MTETEFKINPQQITHHKMVSEDGWVLKWEGNKPDRVFEVVCPSANQPQVEILEKLLAEGYKKAVARFT